MLYAAGILLFLTLTIASFRLGTQHGTRNAAASTASTNSSVTDSSTRAWIVTDLGCLGGALIIAMHYFCSSLRLCLTSCLTELAASRHRLGQNTSGGFQQQDAGVTPEARRDRAAILRRDGVAPLRRHPVLDRVQCPALQVVYFFDSTQILLFAQVKVGVKNPVK